MILSANQRRAIDSIVSIFETGRVPTDESYGTATILADGAGFSFGKHQATDRANSLDRIVLRYIDLHGPLAFDFGRYAQRLADNESAGFDPKNPPAWAKEFMALLRQSGSDPIMKQTQDEVFDEAYWVPAATLCDAMGLRRALSALAVYDCAIHSGPSRVSKLRALFPERSPANGGDEIAWTLAFIKARRAWLAGFDNPVVQKTVYRCDALLELARSANWDLLPPLVVRGVAVE